MRKKLLWSYFTVVIIAVLSTAFFQTKISQKVYMDELKDRIIDNSKTVSWVLKNYDDSYTKITNGLSDKIVERITIIDKTGKVLADSDADVRYLENHKNRPEVKKAMHGKSSFVTRYSKSIDKEMLYYAVPIKFTGQKVAVLRLAVPIKSKNIIDDKFYKYVFLEILFALIGGILIAYYYTDRISSPISEMSRTAQYIASGHFECKIDVEFDDEIGFLAASFNFMVDKLNSLIRQLKHQNIEKESILNSMITGVIGINIDHNVLYINPIAEQWFNIDLDQVKGKNILDAIRSSKLDNALAQSIENGIEHFEDLIIQDRDRYYKIYINLTKYEHKVNGAVIVIQDITDQKSYNDMRTQFVANVSHELKTPLTSILGFVETLKMVDIDDVETKNKFLGIIEKESKRLQNLINDLLSISVLENKKEHVEYTNVNVKDCIDEVITILSNSALSKNIKLNVQCEQKFEITGNRDRVKQMFINLVDNAIKYTPNGGKVGIYVTDLQDRISISVEDSGIGIAQADISRLFERFYRADKSRSRNLGGTGLGLSIVKHIVMSMQGDIKVESKMNVGSKFIVILPKEQEK